MTGEAGLPDPGGVDEDAAFITPALAPDHDDDLLDAGLLGEDLDDDGLLDDDPLDEDSAFEPPDPGPLELPHHPVARFAWAGALGGPTVLLLANVLNWGSFIAGLGVAAGVAGFVTLIARHRDDRDDDFTDGAVV